MAKYMCHTKCQMLDRIFRPSSDIWNFDPKSMPERDRAQLVAYFEPLDASAKKAAKNAPYEKWAYFDLREEVKARQEEMNKFGVMIEGKGKVASINALKELASRKERAAQNVTVEPAPAETIIPTAPPPKKK